MMRIATRIFGQSNIDLDSRWGSFVKFLTQSNGSSDINWNSSSAAIVFVDFTERDLLELSSKPFLGPKILILVEPPAVNPFQYKPSVLVIFDKIYSFSREVSSEVGAEYVRFMTPSRNWRTEIKNSDLPPKFGMIAANKNSFHSKSQYILRRSFIQALSSSELNFVYAGPCWENSIFKEAIEDFRSFNYFRKSKTDFEKKNFRILKRKPKLNSCLGLVDSKESFLSEIDVEICIENCEGELSEKLFDSLQANTVPAYIGVDLVAYGIPNEIALLPPKNPKKAYDFFNSLSQREIDQTRKNGQDWWRSNNMHWEDKFKMKDFAHLVNDFIESVY
jgi:hypothetical protein